MSLGAARKACGNAARLLKSGVAPSPQARQLAAMRQEEAGTTFEAVAREWHGQQVSGWVPRHAAALRPAHVLAQCMFTRA
jgi:ABC-type proline/glycine betaine transport system substrate-binding protein